MSFSFSKTSLVFLGVIILITGCAGKKVSQQAVPMVFSGTNKTIVTAVTGYSGRVASVNKTARFVVLSYPIGQEPPMRQKLNVYRNNLKVGELRVTGPQSEGNTVADITAGDVEIDDEVSED